MVKYGLGCWDLLLFCADFFVMIHFMDREYGNCRLHSGIKWGMAVSVALLSGAVLWDSPLHGTYPVFCVLMSLPFLFMYEGSQQKKLLFFLLELAAAGYLVMFVLAIVRALDINLNRIGPFYWISGGMHAAFWGIIWIMGFFHKKKRERKLPIHLAGGILAVPLTSLVVLACFAVRIDRNGDMLFMLEIPVLCTFLFLNVMIAFLYWQFCDAMQKSGELLLLEQQLRLSERHFAEMSGEQNKVRGIRHDMKNHLQTISLLLCREPVPLQEIRNYVRELTEDIGKTEQLISTGNLGLDAILSLKLSAAGEKEMRVEKEIAVPPQMKISFEDEIVIIGNLLDNAITACEKLPVRERRMHLEMTYGKGNLFIRISNSAGVTDGENERRQDKEGHGFGLQNVCTVIRKYDGVLETERRKESFVVRLVLYGV